MLVVKFEKAGRRALAYSGLGGDDLAKAAQFAEVLQQYSCANVSRVGIAASQYLAGGVENTGLYADVGLYAHLFFADAERNNWSFKIHAPAADLLNDDHSVKSSLGDLIAAQLSLVAGFTLTFNEGYLCGSTGNYVYDADH